MADVNITTEHLAQLAGKQEEAAAGSGSAATAASGMEQKVWVSHGVASGASNQAFTDAEKARHQAGKALQQASIDLAAKLRAAAAAYDSADEQTSANIAKQVRHY